MCDPVSATVALTAVAGGFAAKSQLDAGKAQAKIANQNAEMAEVQSADRARVGLIEEERVRQQVRRAVGAQRAGLAANGVEIGSGTALSLQTDTAGLGEVDAYLARNNALREAWGLRVDASNSRNQARVAKVGSRNQAIGTVLSTGANAFGSYSTLS
ncbi:MAG TPA: hypothetical protein VFZ38_10755 [Vicinamibacterales bacterium]